MSYNNLLYIDGDNYKADLDLLREAQQVIYNTLGLSRNSVISLKFCSDSEMREINKRYRGVDETTDVISFPADRDTGLYKTDEEGAVYLGEILIDISYIEKQEKQFGLKIEILRVFVHGVLHLLGYDHLNSQQMKDMQSMEEKINSLIAKDVNLNG